MRLAAGTVRVGPHEIPAARRRAAALVAVARAEPAVGLEGRLRVGELVAERCWLARGVTRADIEETAERLGLTLRDRVLAEDLAPLDGLRLALALTAAERPAAIVVDDVDRGCTAEQRTAAWRSVLAVRDLGCTVLAGSLDRPGTACDDCDDEVELPRLSRDRLPTAAGHDVVNGEAQ
jgi:ABC-2 type transport system ATP-binding protein